VQRSLCNLLHCATVRKRRVIICSRAATYSLVPFTRLGIVLHIERLAKILDGCRKVMLLSKVAILAGGIWILAYLLGAIPFEPATMVGAIAVIIGGIVVFGSSTSKQSTAAMKAAEMRRAELIDMIDPRAVGTNRVWGSPKD
jgi:hypothetical protein